MKNKLTGFLTALVCAVLCGSTASAANRVPDIDIQVALRDDGSAHITQTWSADTDEGTEFYLARNDSGYLNITDFSVSDENGTYTFVEDWNINASFKEKANRCGIVETADGVELCWGISQYGKNTYTFEYVVHDLVGRYSDADGFNHRFVDEMSFFPSNVTLTICNEDGTDLTDDLCDIWAFGYDGQIVFDNGTIHAWTDSPMEDGHHMTIMVALEQSVLSPLRIVDDSFETVKERAFQGSDYDDGEELTPLEWFFTIFIMGLFCLVVLVQIYVVFSVWNFLVNSSVKARVNRRMKKADYFRESPNEGNLNVSHKVGTMSRQCKEESILGAYLLRLISSGCLEPVSQNVDDKNVELHLVKSPDHSDPFEDILYTILETAAGPDGVLQSKELETYCRKNPKPMSRFMDSCSNNAKTTLAYKGAFANGVGDSLNSLSEDGLEQLDELLGFKKYLLDFSLIHERGVKETVIWQDCLVYAYLMGIADQVAPQLQKMYPHELPQMQQYNRYIRYATAYNTAMYRPYARRKKGQQVMRAAGSGGRASFGGGGGFSGGGRGGTR